MLVTKYNNGSIKGINVEHFFIDSINASLRYRKDDGVYMVEVLSDIEYIAIDGMVIYEKNQNV